MGLGLLMGEYLASCASRLAHVCAGCVINGSCGTAAVAVRQLPAATGAAAVKHAAEACWAGRCCVLEAEHNFLYITT